MAYYDPRYPSRNRHYPNLRILLQGSLVQGEIQVCSIACWREESPGSTWGETSSRCSCRRAWIDGSLDRIKVMTLFLFLMSCMIRLDSILVLVDGIIIYCTFMHMSSNDPTCLKACMRVVLAKDTDGHVIDSSDITTRRVNRETRDSILHRIHILLFHYPCQ